MANSLKRDDISWSSAPWISFSILHNVKILWFFFFFLEKTYFIDNHKVNVSKKKIDNHKVNYQIQVRENKVSCNTENLNYQNSMAFNLPSRKKKVCRNKNLNLSQFLFVQNWHLNYPKKEWQGEVRLTELLELAYTTI